MKRAPRLSRSMQLRLQQRLKLQRRLLEQQGFHLREKRSALERELSISDLLSELVQDTELRLSPGMTQSGVSIGNTNQFKSLLSEGLFIRQRKSDTLQEECRQMTETLLASRRLVSHQEAILNMICKSRQRQRQRILQDEWLMRAQGRRTP